MGDSGDCCGVGGAGGSVPCGAGRSPAGLDKGLRCTATATGAELVQNRGLPPDISPLS
jgi:hypothetical protein